jgi:hypothetical protein
MLRAGNDDYLSVNWLESTGAASQTEQLSIVRQQFLAKGRTLAPTAVFAILNVGHTVSEVQSKTEDHRRLTVNHEPDVPHDPSHSGIYGYTATDHLIADLIAQTVLAVEPARQP